MAAVSNGGSLCRTYADCVDALRTQTSQIDYNGPSGLTEIGAATGDTDARPVRRVHDRRGRQRRVSTTFVVGA